MKKERIINLIKYHAEDNDRSFRNEAYQIASEFDKMGDYQLAEYIMALLSSANTFVPQVIDTNLEYLSKVEITNNPLPLPEDIKNDIVGIINATKSQIGVNKFLLEGKPGTGKTETVKHIARILNRELYVVDFSTLIDSKLGQTVKNIKELFLEINHKMIPEKTVVLFDEIDALALDRTNAEDLREMGRATTAVFKGLDELDERILLIATTNLFDHFDKALIRRFDTVINFNRYCRDDLIEIAEIILNEYLNKNKNLPRNIRLFKKIISLLEEMPLPGDLVNLIKTSIAFSDQERDFDYLRVLYQKIQKTPLTLQQLKEEGFTVREIEVLTGVSKSQVARGLN